MTETNQATHHPTNPAIHKGWIETFHRHHKGKKLGPYFVRKWKANGKVHREYIKPKDLERVRAACQANREQRKRTIEANKSGFVFKGNWDFLHRITTRAAKGKPIMLEEVAHLVRILREGWDAPGRPKLRRKREPFQITRPRIGYPVAGSIPDRRDGAIAGMFDWRTSHKMLGLLGDQLAYWLTRDEYANPQSGAAVEAPFIGACFTNEKAIGIKNQSPIPLENAEQANSIEDMFRNAFKTGPIRIKKKPKRIRRSKLEVKFMKAFYKEGRRQKRLARTQI